MKVEELNGVNKRFRFQTGQSLLLVLALLFGFQSLAFSQSNAKADLSGADQLFSQGNYVAAGALYRDYLLRYTDGELANKASYRLGDCYYLSGEKPDESRWRRAVSAYGDALARFPDEERSSVAAYRLGKTYVSLKNLEDAANTFKDLLQNFPEFESRQEVLFLMAEANYSLENYAKALPSYTEYVANEVDPGKVLSASLKLADSYHKIRNYSGFLNIIEPILKEQPRILSGRTVLAFQWGESLLMTGRYPEAEIVLFDLGRKFRQDPIYPHVTMRIGDLDRLRSLDVDNEETKDELLSSAINYYRQLINNEENQDLAHAAALRVAKIADDRGFDLEKDFDLPSQEELLQKVLAETGNDINLGALVSVRLARHYLLNGQNKQALDHYKKVIINFAGIQLSEEVLSEYNRVVRGLLNGAYASGDHLSYVDYYLGNGQSLSLSTPERLRLAESYAAIQLYERAEAIFNDILRFSISPEVRLKILVEQAKIKFALNDFPEAFRYIQEVQQMSPSSPEAEEATLIQFDIYYSLRDLDTLRSYFLDRTEELSSPSLRSSALIKLAMLSLRSGKVEEAEDYFESFNREFGEGRPADNRLYSLIREGYLALADVYYRQARWNLAVGKYQMFIVLFGRDENIAWPLFQAAHCLTKLGRNQLADDMLSEMLRLYPNHYLKLQAEASLELIRSTGTTGAGL